MREPDYVSVPFPLTTPRLKFDTNLLIILRVRESERKKKLSCCIFLPMFDKVSRENLFLNDNENKIHGERKKITLHHHHLDKIYFLAPLLFLHMRKCLHFSINIFHPYELCLYSTLRLISELDINFNCS